MTSTVFDSASTAKLLASDSRTGVGRSGWHTTEWHSGASPEQRGKYT